MPPAAEARIVEMRRAHPGWGPRTLVARLAREGLSPVPGRTSVERCLIRHGLLTPQARKRRRQDYKRWERSRAMELWQMDVVSGVHLNLRDYLAKHTKTDRLDPRCWPACQCFIPKGCTWPRRSVRAIR